MADRNSVHQGPQPTQFKKRGNKDESLLVTQKKPKLKSLPPIPQLPKQVEEQFSGVHGLEFPPILQTNSWTRSAPYKQEFTDLSPGENIGNHFSGVKYRMRELVHPPKPKQIRVQVDIKAFKAPPPTLDKKYTSGICSYSVMPVETLLTGDYKITQLQKEIEEELLPAAKKKVPDYKSEKKKLKRPKGCPKPPDEESVAKSDGTKNFFTALCKKDDDQKEENLADMSQQRLLELIAERFTKS